MVDVASLLAGLILNNKKALNKIFNSKNPSAVLTLNVKKGNKGSFRIVIEKG